MMWERFFKQEQEKTYYKELMVRLDDITHRAIVYPSKDNWFKAFTMTPFESVKVVIIGQDPYHGPCQADGLAFSVQDNVKIPPSLNNIFKSIEQDFQIRQTTGNLQAWASQGVLLLNRILTVTHGQPLSHKDLGWEIFTQNAIAYLCEHHPYLIFVLWGKQAQQVEKVLPKYYDVIKAAHPSPLSVYRGFYEAHCFTQINTYLTKNNLSTIDWRCHK